MSLSIIVQQMGVICILVAIGFYLQKKDVIDALTSKKLSAIVVDVCNPAMIMASILSGNVTATHQDLLTAIVLGADGGRDRHWVPNAVQAVRGSDGVHGIRVG